MADNLDELYVGNGKKTDAGFTIELNLEKINKAFERPDVQLALKKFKSKKGEETSIMLYLTELKPEEQNQWRTHSLKINTKYRQKTD